MDNIFDRYRIRKCSNGYILTIVDSVFEEDLEKIVENEILFEFKEFKEEWSKVDEFEVEVIKMGQEESEHQAFADLLNHLVEEELLGESKRKKFFIRTKVDKGELYE